MMAKAYPVFVNFTIELTSYYNPDGNPVETAGPEYITKMFIRYNHMENNSTQMIKTDWSSNSPYFIKESIKRLTMMLYMFLIHSTFHR
jgi:hypothetical protein